MESKLAGINSIGIDLNPLACIISKLKTTPIDYQILKNSWNQLQTKMKKEFSKFKIGSVDIHLSNKTNKYTELDKKLVEKLPTRRKSDKFTETKRRDLLIIKDSINNVLNQQLANFYKVALSSTISSFLTSQSKKFDLWRTFQRKVDQMIPRMAVYEKELKEYSSIPTVDIYHKDARSFPREIQDDSIDLVITSPTYVNVFDYYRQYIYNAIFLEMIDKTFRRKEIGAHKRQKENRFRLLTEYLADMYRVLNEIARVTKEKGYVCFVVGESCIEFERIHTQKHLIDLGKTIGLKHLSTFNRVIDAGNKYANRGIGNIDEEYILIFTVTSSSRVLTKKLMVEKITDILKSYEKHIQTSQGTCIRNFKTLSENRLAENRTKIRSAIEKISKDIEIKD